MMVRRKGSECMWCEFSRARAFSHTTAMVHILGINLPDNQLARVRYYPFSLLCTTYANACIQFALTSIYGVGPHLSHRLCARFQIHDKCRVKDLTPLQTTSLASFLQSPKTALPLPQYPLAPVNFVARPPSKSIQELQAEFNAARTAQKQKREEKLLQLGQSPAEDAKGKTTTTRGRKALEKKSRDPLTELRIESELRREIRENIAHQRMIGSYVGRRHAMHLPVSSILTTLIARGSKRYSFLFFVFFFAGPWTKNPDQRQDGAQTQQSGSMVNVVQMPAHFFVTLLCLDCVNLVVSNWHFFLQMLDQFYSHLRRLVSS